MVLQFYNVCVFLIWVAVALVHIKTMRCSKEDNFEQKLISTELSWIDLVLYVKLYWYIVDTDAIRLADFVSLSQS